jgi:hypothetical protein
MIVRMKRTISKYQTILLIVSQKVKNPAILSFRVPHLQEEICVNKGLIRFLPVGRIDAVLLFASPSLLSS